MPDYAAVVSTQVTLREHARGAVREEVMRQAWTLFAEQGFEATTVDEVAAASGMSRRTFFRYFTGKDELVLERLLEAGDRVAAVLRDRPPDEPAWTALRVAFAETVDLQEQHADRSRPLQLMLRDEPGLRASLLEGKRRWHQMLTPLVARRLPARADAPGPDVRASALAAGAVACLDAASLLWAENPGSRLSLLLDQAMDAVAGPAG